MYTIFQRQLAAMAFNAYRPSSANDLDLGEQGWSVITPAPLPGSGGFDATVYQSSNGQIVIAFRGTDSGGIFSFLADAGDDIAIARGALSEQVMQAIALVADVRSAHPSADIQLTGHSLGGGLASLMSVYFDLPAYIFAPAPFEFSAVNKAVLPVLHDTDLVQQYLCRASYLRDVRLQ